jgi:hypothetical protein
MQRHPVDRAASACELRYNLFRAKWHSRLCCAVPEDQPVPGFITGESWDFGGTWGGVLPRPANAAVVESGVCLNGCHLLQVAGAPERLAWPSTTRAAACSKSERGTEREWRLDDERTGAPAELKDE